MVIRLLLVVAAVAVVPLFAIETEALPATAAPPAIEEWILHFDKEYTDINAVAYRSLLKSLPGGVRVLVVLPADDDRAEFVARAAPSPEMLRRTSFVTAGRNMSTWARDRYIVFERGGRRCILLQPAEEVHALWRADLDAAAQIGLRSSTRLRRIASHLSIEGGDLLITRKRAFVGVGSIEENALRLRCPAELVRRQLEAALGRDVVVVGRSATDTPHDHVDMYLHALEDGSVLLGDPRVAAAHWTGFLDDPATLARLRRFGPSSAEEQRLAATHYDEIAEQLTEQGIRVHRVPALHADVEDVLLSYTNAVTETRVDGAWAYVPRYGLPALDRAAGEVWARLGFRVRRVDCADPAFHGGAVRCFTNVIRRLPDGAARPQAGANRPVARPAVRKAG